MSSWVWVVIVFVLLGAQIIDGMRQISSPLFWFGRQMMVLIWKHQNKYPVEISPIKGEQIVIFHQPHVGNFIESRPKVMELIVECPLRIKIRNKQSREEIKSIKLKLSGTDYSVEGGESYKQDYTRLTGKGLNDIANDIYNVLILISIDDKLKAKYNANNVSDIEGIINFSIGERICIARLGVLRRI